MKFSKTILSCTALCVACNICESAEQQQTSGVVAKVALTVNGKKTVEEYRFGLQCFYPISSYLWQPQTWLKTRKQRKNDMRVLAKRGDIRLVEPAVSFTDRMGISLKTSQEPVELIGSLRVAVRYHTTEELETPRIVTQVFLLDADGDKKTAEYVGCITAESRAEQLELARLKGQYQAHTGLVPVSEWTHRLDYLAPIKTQNRVRE